MTIGQMIQTARVKRGLTQGQVEDIVKSEMYRDDQGRAVSLSEGGLSRIEAGGRMPAYTTLVALARALKVTFVITPEGTEVVDDAYYMRARGGEK